MHLGYKAYIFYPRRDILPYEGTREDREGFWNLFKISFSSTKILLKLNVSLNLLQVFKSRTINLQKQLPVGSSFHSIPSQILLDSILNKVNSRITYSFSHFQVFQNHHALKLASVTFAQHYSFYSFYMKLVDVELGILQKMVTMEKSSLILFSTFPWYGGHCCLCCNLPDDAGLNIIWPGFWHESIIKVGTILSWNARKCLRKMMHMVNWAICIVIVILLENVWNWQMLQ